MVSSNFIVDRLFFFRFCDVACGFLIDLENLRFIPVVNHFPPTTILVFPCLFLQQLAANCHLTFVYLLNPHFSKTSKSVRSIHTISFLLLFIAASWTIVTSSCSRPRLYISLKAPTISISMYPIYNYCCKVNW